MNEETEADEAVGLLYNVFTYFDKKRLAAALRMVYRAYMQNKSSKEESRSRLRNQV